MDTGWSITLRSGSMSPVTRAEIDPTRFVTKFASVRGVRLAYVHEGTGGVPIVLAHGWPESKRIFWRVIEPLVDAGFEVIVPDLRGFGESEPGDFGDTVACAFDLIELMRLLEHEHYVVAGGDAGGPVVQEMALRSPSAINRMVLFNSPLPIDKVAMSHLRTRPAKEAADYFFRQGLAADELARELRTEAERIRYVSAFYGSRFWAHPGAFDSEAIAFHAAPFGDSATLRSSFRFYESSFSKAAQSEPPMLRMNPDTKTLVLFGPSDHVLYPDFDRMAALVFPNHVGPFLLRDCGHFVPWEAAHAFVTATTMFCSDLLVSHP